MSRSIVTLSWLLVLCGGLAMTGAHAASVVVEVVDARGVPLSDAVVFLESPSASKLVQPVVGAEIVQEARQFQPATLVIPRGTFVQFPNRDTVRHHVYSFSPTKRFELKLYTGTHANPVHFDRAGVVILGCNIHDQMVGWIVVVDTSHYGKTSSTGKFRLDGVPAGGYRLRVWHHRLPVGGSASDQPLEVSGDRVASARVVLQGLQP